MNVLCECPKGQCDVMGRGETVHPTIYSFILVKLGLDKKFGPVLNVLKSI